MEIKVRNEGYNEDGKGTVAAGEEVVKGQGPQGF